MSGDPVARFECLNAVKQRFEVSVKKIWAVAGPRTVPDAAAPLVTALDGLPRA
jgi:hypothetical protein